MPRRWSSGVGRFGLAMALIVLGLAGAAVGQDAEAPYKLEWCVRVGLTNSAAAVNARRDRLIADTRVVQTRAEALPTLSVQGRYTRLDELQDVDFGTEDGVQKVGTLDNYSASAAVSQLLYSGGRVRAALRAANLSRTYADAERAETDTALVVAVRTGFYDLLLARDTIAVQESVVDQLTALLEQTESKFRNGAASEYDVLTARVRLANEQPKLIRARNVYELGREALLRILAVDDPGFEPAGELAYEPIETDVVELEREALQQRPLIRRLETRVQLREEDLMASHSGARPSLRAEASYNGANSYGFVSFEDDWEWHWNAGVVLEWDLWDGGLTRGRVGEKRLERDKSVTDLDDGRRAVRTEVRQACLDLSRATEAVEAGRGTVALAEKGLSIAKSRYDNGLATYLEYTDSTVALSTARLSERQALRDHAVARARLIYAVGRNPLDP